MKLIPLVISLLLVGVAACRRSEERSSAISETKETVETADNSIHPTEPELVDDPDVVPRRVGGTTHNDPEYSRIVSEIAACDLELKPLEAKFAEQNEIIDKIFAVLNSESEIPEEVKKLLIERQSNRASIQSLNDRRYRLFKEGEEWSRRLRN